MDLLIALHRVCAKYRVPKPIKLALNRFCFAASWGHHCDNRTHADNFGGYCTTPVRCHICLIFDFTSDRPYSYFARRAYQFQRQHILL